MQALISKSKISGKIRAPSSKSYTIRGLMCAALSCGESEIENPLNSDDTLAAINVLSKIGIDIYHEESPWRISGGKLREPNSELFCGDSAATLRFMTAICSIVPGKCRLTVGSSLARRPVKPLVQVLKKIGVNISSQDKPATVIVNGTGIEGGIAELSGDISSQFVSALLLIAPFAKREMSIKLTSSLESKPYVLMTLNCLNRFGINVCFSKKLDEFKILPQRYQPAKYHIEGDWSSASYLLALGALMGEMEVTGLDTKSLQGDKIILDFLKKMGARVIINNDSIIVRKTQLRAIRADMSQSIDLLPTMAVLAAVADGKSVFIGIERARIKESNRITALREGLVGMGVKVVDKKDSLTIEGSSPKSSVIDTKSDHRIAMAFGVLGSVVGKTLINNAECVNKTYPLFWEVLKGLGGGVKISGE